MHLIEQTEQEGNKPLYGEGLKCIGVMWPKQAWIKRFIAFWIINQILPVQEGYKHQHGGGDGLVQG